MSSSDRVRVMLVCGSGIVSSTLVYPMVEDILRDNGYNFEIIKGGFHEIKNYSNIRLVLTTMAQVPPEVVSLNIPVVVVTDLFKGDSDRITEEINRVLRG